ncbi:MAG: TPM domain-containing protein [Alistipes sp.]|nr:TPM domain-containing protein [Alistipes sp.]
MGRTSVYIFLLVTWLAAGVVASGQVYTVDEVPDVHRYDGRRYVSDPAGILPAADVSRLDALAAGIETATGAQTAVVVVPSIGNDTPEDFAVRLFEKWGIGSKKQDTGLLLLLATEDRLVRFEVGYGLEGVLTDALSKRIQTQRMNPYLTRGDWGGGLVAGLTAVEELLTDPSSELKADRLEETEGLTGMLILMGLALLMLIGGISLARRQRKCPRCGAQMKPVNQTTRMVSPGVRMITTVMRCPKCGYTTTRTQREDIGAAVAGGTIAGGLGGLGRGGMGGFGGGWAGGRSGGGGATSRF